MPELRFMVFVLLAFACGQAQPKYTIQDLGSVPSMPTCFASALSQSGIVTGYCIGANPAAGNRGFLNSKGSMTSMAGAGQLFLVPSAVNDAGTVVGAYVQATYTQLSFNGPFLYQNGAFQGTGFLQSFGSGNNSFAPFALNNSGQVCGSVAALSATSSWNYLNFSQAYMVPVAGGQPTQLLPPAGIQYAGALTQSANGTWVGGGVGSPGAYQPALWHNGTIQLLPRLGGYASSFVSGVNDSGLAAGSGYTITGGNTGTGHAAMFSNGVVTDLGVLPGDQNVIPTGINNSGQIVGWSTPAPVSMNLEFDAVYVSPSGNIHAFLYTGGTMYDLSKLLVNGTGWQLGYAVAINNAGQIAGTGLYQNQQRAFLLTPVVPVITSVIDAASQGTRLAPGSAASVFGTNLPTDASQGALVGGQTAQVLLATATQWNIVIPATASTGATTIQIGASAPFNITLLQYAPALFSNAQAGQGMVMAARAASASGSTSTITATNPALPGDILTVYGTGLGSTTAATTTVLLAGASIAPSSVGPVSGSPGTYQVVFTVPATIAAGNQKISVTVGGQSSNTLTLPVGAVATPGPVITAVQNGASYQDGFPSGAWMQIKGANLSTVALDYWTNYVVANNGQLPTTLDGVSVTVNGQPAYIYVVTPGQINVVAPNVTAGPATVVVKNSLGTSAGFVTNAAALQPAFFPWPGGYVVATRPDYTWVVKNGTFSGTTTVPAHPGDIIILWGTGFGPTTPAAPTGVAVPAAAYNTINPVTVTVGGVAATVYNNGLAALASGNAALYQVAIQIPASLANGDYAVVATINGVSSPSSSLITVQQ